MTNLSPIGGIDNKNSVPRARGRIFMPSTAQATK
jgi:hypothetical protein